MAAALNALRTAITRMGFTDEAALAITTSQGIDSLSELELLTDGEIENLCKVVRRPGGQVAQAAGAAAGQAQPNLGIAVSLKAENNLKLAAYFLRFRTRTSRTTVATDITAASVRALRDHKQYEEKHKDVDPPEIDGRDWPRTIDGIEEWLRGCLGVTKIPLAYVIRADEGVPAADPPEGYLSKVDELIARAPIRGNAAAYTATFLTDRTRVWEKISDLTREHECWSYVRPAQRTRDGRLAFMNLKGHYLGVNSVDNMSAEAERKLMTTTYTSEQRRWNFERYVKVHVDQHSILEGLTDHGYSGIDVRSKVRYLLAGIKTTSLDPVRTRILSDATLRQDFDACVNLFNDFIKQRGATNNVRDSQVAAFDSRKSNDSAETDADMTVKDRYYSKSEYSNLSTAKKNGLRLKRKKRGHKTSAPPKGKGQKKQKAGSPKVSKRMIKAVAAAMKDMSDDSEEEDSKKVSFPDSASNRTNSALTRKS